jgi:tetratricopeptide (TPR) repeat protein
MRISPDERKLRKQLEETRKMLESWDGWSPHEAAGRCLRWLGEGEEAAEHFRITGRKYPVGDSPQGYGLLAAGNLYRLAGEHDEARALFSRGRDLLRAGIDYELKDQGDYVDKDFLLADLTCLDLCCFFLGRYEEVEDLEAFERRLDPDRTISWTGRIARAKRLGDLGEAIRAADEVSEGIRKHRSRVTNTGLVNDWDIYELALENRRVRGHRRWQPERMLRKGR